jgi:hypothetical protein
MPSVKLRTLEAKCEVGVGKQLKQEGLRKSSEASLLKFWKSVLKTFEVIISWANISAFLEFHSLSKPIFH